MGDYFKAIKKSKRIRWSENSLRQAYAVALEFPDLSEKRENRLCFSSYREIANAGISPEEKQEIRKIAEEEELRFGEVRKLIKTEYKKEEVKETDNSEIKEEIVYHTEEDFVKRVKEFLKRHKDLEAGTTIILQFKNRK